MYINGEEEGIRMGRRMLETPEDGRRLPCQIILFILEEVIPRARDVLGWRASHVEVLVVSSGNTISYERRSSENRPASLQSQL